MARTPLEPRDLRHTSEPIRGERTERNTQPGAVAPEPQHRRRRLGWLWALLALLAVALIAAAAIGLFDGGDDAGEGTGRAQGTAEQPGGAEQRAGGADEQDGASGGAAPGAGGSLTAGGTSILPPPAGGLGDFVGRDATGDAVVVQSVVRNAEDDNTLEGFWVGRSEQDRVYVEWGGTVGSNEADYIPKVGEQVDLTGPVRPAPENPETALKLTAADAELVRSSGGFVNADEVSPAQS